jgi:hypothetical protein
MSRTLTTQDISWFLDLKEKGQLNLDPPYQRRSVWSPRDKRYFIDTILNNYPAPPIFLHKTLDDKGRSTYHVVDGKQRLQTIIDFTENKVRIPDDFIDIGLQKKRWRELERVTKERFWNYSLIAEMLPDVSDAAIRNIFERINRNSRRLTAQEMRHAKYDGWFITFVEAEADKAEWKTYGVVTAARIKRMADAQFISELCAVVIRGQISGFDQDDLDQLYADYEDTSDVAQFVEEEFIEEIERLKAEVGNLISFDARFKEYLKVQGHFYSLWAYLHASRESYRGAEECAPEYIAFMEAVAAVSAANDDDELGADGEIHGFPAAAVRDYARNIRGASTDLAPRRKRLEGLLVAMRGPEPVAHEDR